MGALGAAVTAGLDGWKPIFLGASLPAEEIALAARERDAKLVALSIVYPPDDAKLPAELRRLRQLLPDGLPLVVGGSGAGAYASALTEIGAVQVGDFSALRAQLQEKGAEVHSRRPPCTACDPHGRFFSHRAMGGQPTGRMAAFIVRTPFDS